MQTKERYILESDNVIAECDHMIMRTFFCSKKAFFCSSFVVKSEDYGVFTARFTNNKCGGDIERVARCRSSLRHVCSVRWPDRNSTTSLEH